MNKLLEELFGDLEMENERYRQLMEEILKASQTDPEAWLTDLNTARERAKTEYEKACALWDEVEKERESADAVEKKAKAIHVYRLCNALYSDIEYIDYNAKDVFYYKTEYPEIYAAELKEWEKKMGGE